MALPTLEQQTTQYQDTIHTPLLTASAGTHLSAGLHLLHYLLGVQRLMGA
jgi:hypothetical protein